MKIFRAIAALYAAATLAPLAAHAAEEANYHIVQRIKVPDGGFDYATFDSAAYDPVTKLAFVLNKESGNATVVDPVARRVVDTIPISPNVLEFPIADGMGRVFDNVETTAQIAVIDTKMRKVTATYTMPGCERPSGLAYAPDSGVLISSCRNGTAKVVRSSDGAVLSSVAIGAGPDAVIYD